MANVITEMVYFEIKNLLDVYNHDTQQENFLLVKSE